jgi:hypothetical protein
MLFEKVLAKITSPPCNVVSVAYVNTPDTNKVLSGSRGSKRRVSSFSSNRLQAVFANKSKTKKNGRE